VLHRGFQPQGGKITKTKRGDKLDALLARNDVSGKSLRTIYDEYNDEEIVLSKEELKMIMRIRKGQFPHVEVRYPECSPLLL
jgi:ribosome biogenesis protein ERB1